MEPNKVYKSLVYLAYNVVKNDRLRYELDNKAIFRDQFVKQINNMLALEKDFNQTHNNQTWTNVFAQAVVKITQQKQRFEKKDGLSIEEIYADYSSFLSYTSTTFEIGRNVLTEELVNFTSEEVLVDANLSEQTKIFYRDLEKEKTIAAAEEARKAEEVKKHGSSKSEFEDNRTYSQPSSGFFGRGQSGVNVGNGNPLQNPRFYPYLSKPKWMPTLKMVFAAIVILATVMLFATTIAMMTVNIDLGPNKDINNPFGKALFGEAWASNKGDWDSFLADSNLQFPLNWKLKGTSAGEIISLIFYALPAIYIGYIVFRRPRSLKEKYRLNIWAVVFMLIMFFVAGSNIINVMSSSKVADSFQQTFKAAFDKEYPQNFDAFWAAVMNKYGDGITSTTTIADVAVGLIAGAFVFGVIILILNPRLDRQKMNQAMTEYQRATLAAMQGQSYQVDPSLFDDDTQAAKAPKPSKFNAWWKKTFSKKPKSSKQSDNQATA